MAILASAWSTPSRTCSGLAAGRRDQPRRQAFLIVDEDLQQMFRGEILVVGAQRQPLRGLNKTARPLSEFLDVHLCLSGPGP